MSSAKQIAANQTNGKKSRGPTTAEGRQKSKMNARKHGLRASRHAALADSGYAQAERRRKWLAQADAQTDFDEFIISGCASLSFKFDRAQRAAAADVATEIDDAHEKDADQADELGDLLFFDPTGPTPVHGIERRPLQKIRPSWNGKAIDPNKPARIVKRLEKTVAGCEFLLREWKRLHALAQTGFWLPPDRFRAIRMLGRQPVDAMEHRGVAMIYVASHGVMRLGETDFDDLHGDLTKVALDRLVVRVKARFKDLFVASTQAECRKLLVDLADQQIKRLNSKAARHLKKAEAEAEQTVDEMGNDRSPSGERMLALEMRCLNTIKRLMAPYKKEAKEKKTGRGKLAAGCPDEGRKGRAEWRNERGETGGHGGGAGGEETCGQGDGGVRDPGRTEGDSRVGEGVELDASDIRACGGFLPARVTGLASGTLESPASAAPDCVESAVDTAIGGESAVTKEAASDESVTNEPNFHVDVVSSQTQCLVEITTDFGVDSGLDKGQTDAVASDARGAGRRPVDGQMTRSVGGAVPKRSLGTRGNDDPRSDGEDPTGVAGGTLIESSAGAAPDCAGSAVDAAIGGGSAVTEEAASGESVTNETNFHVDVILSQPQDLVGITTDFGVDSGLDKAEIHAGGAGRRPVDGQMTRSVGGAVPQRSLGTTLIENPRSGGEGSVGAGGGGPTLLADPSAACGGISPPSGEESFTDEAVFGEDEEAELRELQAQLAIETVKRCS